MGEANKGRRSKEMENLSLELDKFPRDLLQRFMSSSSTQQQSQQAETHEESEDIELNLGLSLGGRFGVDKHAKKLTRSSSIVGTMPLVREDESTTPPPMAFPGLMRTSSLPTGTEEEWRKRKELQTLRRMAAKKRRSEKQRNYKTEREGGAGGLEEEKRETGDKQSQFVAYNRFGSTGSSSPFGLPSWATSARQVVLGDILAKGKPSSQGSVDSQGGSSSGMSEMESTHFQGKKFARLSFLDWLNCIIIIILFKWNCLISWKD